MSMPESMRVRKKDPSRDGPLPRRLASYLQYGIEVVTLLLVCLSPWAFASIHPIFQSMLLSGVSVLVLLWAARILLQRQFVFRKCPVSACLVALILLGLWQVTPLPRSVLSWV